MKNQNQKPKRKSTKTHKQTEWIIHAIQKSTNHYLSAQVNPSLQKAMAGSSSPTNREWSKIRTTVRSEYRRTSTRPLCSAAIWSFQTAHRCPTWYSGRSWTSKYPSSSGTTAIRRTPATATRAAPAWAVRPVCNCPTCRKVTKVSGLLF